MARRRSVASVRKDASQSARGVTASSAAAVGVAARRSAAKSQIVKSVSWPTPEITGMRQLATAYATSSSLNDHKSSMLPPPRHTIRTSQSLRSEAVSMAAAIFCAANWPCTGVGYSTTLTCGARRRRAVSTSRSAAACGLVTMPTVRGNMGNARLRSGWNRPAASSFSFRRKNASNSEPTPARRIASTLIW